MAQGAATQYGWRICAGAHWLVQSWAQRQLQNGFKPFNKLHLVASMAAVPGAFCLTVEMPSQQ